MGASRLLPYLFEALREAQAICDDGQMWAALDGAFIDSHGRPVTRKDFAIWAHQYRVDNAAGKPRNSEALDRIVNRLRG